MIYQSNNRNNYELMNDFDEQINRQLQADSVRATNTDLQFLEDHELAKISSSSGHKSEDSGSEDEDEDGQGETAQLFQEGVSEAVLDQMLQAARAAAETSPYSS